MLDWAGKLEFKSAEEDELHTAIGALLERLLEAWGECTPGQMSSAPELTAIQCCAAILDCSKLLLARLPKGSHPLWHPQPANACMRPLVAYAGSVY